MKKILVALNHILLFIRSFKKDKKAPDAHLPP